MATTPHTTTPHTAAPVSPKKPTTKAALDTPPWPPVGAPPEFTSTYPDGWTIAYEQRHRSDYYDSMGEVEFFGLIDERDAEGHPLYGVVAPASAPTTTTTTTVSAKK